ncbi:dihydrolipoamide acetyltransferase family protein [Sulfurovum riftiae]|uniref:Dihydrolipoamide acetyltransferase component of pyruvate dehydrogenase complex n=1 Tax=Sulfurovum riftiae TaxID=1630136 RepID=A0A151CGD6_9BACT|nr:dihydrolipoamide acetyltransferase family protein [Sulfurovum riftiae]KYJ86605.1 pyruvate dehydrogenase [Sulfurovum riftiae]
MSLFKMPSLGADMESGTLMEWKVKEGDRVKKGQVIAEVESNKGVIDVEIFEDGVVDKLLVEPGTTCAVGTPIASIRGENETAEASAAEEVPTEKSEAPKAEEKPVKASEEKEEAAKVQESAKEEMPEVSAGSSEHEVRVSPAARKRAKELGVDLEALAAKIEGKIGTAEVEAAAATVEKKKRGGSDSMRKAIAAAMSRSNAEIPHYYLSTSINMTPALEWLAEQNEKRSIKERILPAALTIRAVVKALQAVPELNGFWQDDALQMSGTISPGVAIAKREGGLVTPALLNAQEMDLDGTMKAFHDLITRTRSGKLRSSEITQQTIVITNLGDLGVEEVFGVIYPPQVALVGLGRIVDAPWVVGDALAVRKVMRATLAGDHRATDGRTGALFLNKLDALLQNPEELL